ncbi:MAG TPA: hypothetical protein DCY97_10310 [Marinilabiliales bacterium]|jgi:hypothetical protein|nr:hypothetical protein [Marinilabiliales bacterium]
MEFQNYNYTDKEEILSMLNSLDQSKRIQAIIGMINGVGDRLWLQNRLLELVHDNDFWVSKNAITGLGDLARIYGELDVQKVLHELRRIKNKQLEGVIKDVIEDINLFIR